MKKFIKFFLIFVLIFANISMVGCKEDPEDYFAIYGENNAIIRYRGSVYNYCEWFDDEYDTIFIEGGDYAGTLELEEVEGREDAFMFLKTGHEDVAVLGSRVYLKEGFELINKYEAKLTKATVSDVGDYNAEVVLPSNLTLNDIIDKERKIDCSIPKEVPYLFISILIEEYDYLCVREVLRVYNGEVYINLTPSREDSTRYNYPIKAEYKSYFSNVIEHVNSLT